MSRHTRKSDSHASFLPLRHLPRPSRVSHRPVGRRLHGVHVPDGDPARLVERPLGLPAVVNARIRVMTLSHELANGPFLGGDSETQSL